MLASRPDRLYRRNSSTQLVRLHRLPNEVLSNIMRVGLGSFDLEDEAARAHWLTTVPATCALWRQIALSTPCLWSHVAFYFAGEHEFSDEGPGNVNSLGQHGSQHPESNANDGEGEGIETRRMRRDLAMAELFFRRSGALKLHLNIRWSSVYSAPTRANIRSFASLLDRHAARIASVVFRGQCSTQFLPGSVFASPSSSSPSSSSTLSPSLLPHSLPSLTSLDIHSDIVPLDDAPNGIPLALFPSDADAPNIDASSPWSFTSLRAPRLKHLTYRAQLPTRAFAELISHHTPKLETLIVHFDTLSERPDLTALSSASLKDLTVIGGDTWTLEQLVGEMPSLESLSTLPHSFASPHHAWSVPTPVPTPYHSRFGGGYFSTSSIEDQCFPSLKKLNMRPMQAFGDEDVEFVNAQRKLEELDLEDRYFPSDILSSLILAPCSPSRSAFSSGSSAARSHSHSRRSSHSIAHSAIAHSPSSLSFFTYFLTPNPSLKVLRLRRSRQSSTSEAEWLNMLALAGSLMAQREGLEVHFVGGAEGVNERGQVRCGPALFGLVRRFRGRVWVTAGAPEPWC